MKILHTSESYYPEVGGMSEMVQQISEQLILLGHEVTVATGKSIKRRNKIINGVRLVEFGEKREGYQEFIKNSTFDVIANFAAQQWATNLILPILDQLNAKKVFVPVGFSGLQLPWYWGYYQTMKKWIKQYDANIFLSNNYRDINFARKYKAKNIKVIPNGVNANEFLKKTNVDIRKKLGIPDDHFLVLNVSSHTGLKGHLEALRIFIKANIPNATYLNIGKHSKSKFSCYWHCQILKALSTKNILIKDLTREQTVAAFKSADIFLFTSKVECSPIVLFECVAAGTPFLTTDVGNAREIIGWTKGGKLLPTNINESAKILTDAYNHPLKKPPNLADKFTWKKIAREYERMYKCL